MSFLSLTLMDVARQGGARVTALIGRQVAGTPHCKRYGGSQKRAELSQQQPRRMNHHEGDHAPRRAAWICAIVVLIVAPAVGGAVYVVLRSLHSDIDRSYDALRVCTQLHGPNPASLPIC